MLKPHGGRLVNRVYSGSDKERILEETGELSNITVSRDIVKEIENIANGVFSPLEGFMVEEDYLNVLNKKRLASDLPWTIPIVLDVNNIDVKVGDDIALIDGGISAVMNVEEIYEFDKKELAMKVFGTTERKHPGVLKTYKMGKFLVGGKINLIQDPRNPYHRYTLSPMETRILFKEKGWQTIAGFQTRNVPHLGHEYVQKTALAFVDGIFINPIIGKKKAGDFRDKVILDTYEALMENYYLRERAVLAILQTVMRYAGPREAIFHAIIRKNFGCTHFIVGRDHAGVGNYYEPYAAQELFDEFPDLGIVPLFFRSFFYCKKCGGVANEKTCPHSEEDHISFSGTEIRDMLRASKIPPKEIMRKEVAEIILKEETPFMGE